MDSSDDYIKSSNKRRNSAPTTYGEDEPNDENHISHTQNGAMSALEQSINRMDIHDSSSDYSGNISDKSRSTKNPVVNEALGYNEKGILRKRVVKKRKSVHFADTSGKVLATFFKSYTKEQNSTDLEGVNKFSHINKVDVGMKQIPDDDSYFPFGNNITNCSKNTANSRRTVLLEITFEQPAVQKNFHTMLRDNLVKLENAIINKNVCSGTIKVRNIAFEKEVFVRYTFDKWKSWNDLQAEYYPNSCTGYTDTFTFSIVVPEDDIKDVEFAICFQCQGNQYWDNNSGKNYCINCSPVWIRI